MLRFLSQLTFPFCSTKKSNFFLFRCLGLFRFENQTGDAQWLLTAECSGVSHFWHSTGDHVGAGDLTWASFMQSIFTSPWNYLLDLFSPLLSQFPGLGRELPRIVAVMASQVGLLPKGGEIRASRSRAGTLWLLRSSACLSETPPPLTEGRGPGEGPRPPSGPHLEDAMLGTLEEAHCSIRPSCLRQGWHWVSDP